MQRRNFIKSAAVAGAGAATATVAAPAIAQSRREMVIVSSWPRDFPGLWYQRTASSCSYH